VERLFASFVAAALSHPTVLLRQIDARLILHRSESVSCVDAEQRVVLGLPWVFEGEQELLEQRRQLIAATAVQEERAVVLARWLKSDRELRRVVVFADDRELADVVATNLQGQLGSTPVIRYRVIWKI
jgi:hypothetical protein